VLTHLSVANVSFIDTLIFSMDDKEIVFVNLAGAIDLNNIGQIGNCLNVPGLEHVPGAK